LEKLRFFSNIVIGRGIFRRKFTSCNRGQSIVEYMMLVALVVGMISFVIATFAPQKARMAGALKDSMQRIISNGSIENGHPLEDDRVRELD
jgi:hypothetical protein